MTDKKIIEFTNDFRLRFGIELDNAVSGDHANKVAAWINRVEEIIYEEIREKCPSFRHTRLGPGQLGAIWRAMLEQGYYLLNNYDMNIFGGIDPVTGGVIPLREIRERAFSPLAFRILKNAGLFYAGIVPRMPDDKLFTTFWPEE